MVQYVVQKGYLAPKSFRVAGAYFVVSVIGVALISISATVTTDAEGDSGGPPIEAYARVPDNEFPRSGSVQVDFSGCWGPCEETVLFEVLNQNGEPVQGEVSLYDGYEHQSYTYLVGPRHYRVLFTPNTPWVVGDYSVALSRWDGMPVYNNSEFSLHVTDAEPDIVVPTMSEVSMVRRGIPCADQEWFGCGQGAGYEFQDREVLYPALAFRVTYTPSTLRGLVETVVTPLGHSALDKAPFVVHDDGASPALPYSVIDPRVFVPFRTPQDTYCAQVQFRRIGSDSVGPATTVCVGHRDNPQIVSQREYALTHCNLTLDATETTLAQYCGYFSEQSICEGVIPYPKFYSDCDGTADPEFAASAGEGGRGGDGAGGGQGGTTATNPASVAAADPQIAHNSGGCSVPTSPASQWPEGTLWFVFIARILKKSPKRSNG